MGLLASLFLILIAGSGFLLAIKPHADFMRPATQQGSSIRDAGRVISVHAAIAQAASKGHPELRGVEDVDRVDYRPDKNVFKVLSKKGHREVQIDGSTGRVLSDRFRTDDFVESVHDLSAFSSWLRDWWLPPTALILMALSLTGMIVWVNPILRRASFRRKMAVQNVPNKTRLRGN